MIISAYTIGNKESYDHNLKSKPETMKLGRQMISGTLYHGGIVWKTRKEAYDFLNGIDYCYDPRVEYQRLGGGMISFSESPGVLCDIYGLILPNGWYGDVTTIAEVDGSYRLLTDSVITQI